MKKTLVLAGFATIAFACNQPGKNSNQASSTNHGAHQDTVSNRTEQIKMNPVTQTMDRMMQDMHSAKSTGNNDIDFAVMMMAHHRGAVDMSQVEVKGGSNSELNAFAQKVIDDQNKEIEMMQEFISKASKSPSANSADFQKALSGSMMAMMNANTAIYGDIDKDFAAQMIPHHQSAIDMAEAYLQYGQEPTLIKLCQNIITSQENEINWLKGWLAKNQ